MESMGDKKKNWQREQMRRRWREREARKSENAMGGLR